MPRITIGRSVTLGFTRGFYHLAICVSPYTDSMEAVVEF